MPEQNNTQTHFENGIRYYSGLIRPDAGVVFVFGSNPEGRHGAGAAKIAREQFGAVYGQGEGLQGNAYAIPTKDLRVMENNALRSISPDAITKSVRKMYETARQHPDRQFMVAYTNTEKASLNGYTGYEMIKMFIAAGPLPENVCISEAWFKTGLFQKANSIDENKKTNDMAITSYKELTLEPGQRIDLSEYGIDAIMPDEHGYNQYRLTEIICNEGGETLVKGKNVLSGEECRIPISDEELTVFNPDVLNKAIGVVAEENIGRKEERVDEKKMEGQNVEAPKAQETPSVEPSAKSDGDEAKQQAKSPEQLDRKESFRNIPMMDERAFAKFSEKKMSGVQGTPELLIVPASEVKAYVSESGAVDTLRHPGAFGKQDFKVGNQVVSIPMHLGNPFSHESERMAHSSVKTASVEDAVKEFEAWLVGAKHLNVEPERKSWIVKNILDGTFYGKRLVYYTDVIPTPKDGADWQKGFGTETMYSMDKAPCHAHIELKYINAPSLLVENINKVNAIRNRAVSVGEAKAWFRSLPSDRMEYFLNMDNLRQDRTARGEHSNADARKIISDRMRDSVLQLMDEPDKAKYYAETFDMLPPIIQADVFNQAAVEEALSTMHHWVGKEASRHQDIAENRNEDSVKTRNIYAGTGENVELSNFREAYVPYTLPTGEKIVFRSVEQGFQYMKSYYCSDPAMAEAYRESILATIDGKELRQLGHGIAIDAGKWDAENEVIMKDLLRSRFSMTNNPLDANHLLGTGTDILTHVQDTSKWRTVFPQLLMEVRHELRVVQGLDDPEEKAAPQYRPNPVQVEMPSTRRVHAEDEKAREEASLGNRTRAENFVDVFEDRDQASRMSPEEWKQHKKEAWQSAAPRIADIWFSGMALKDKQEALRSVNWDSKARNKKYAAAPYLNEVSALVSSALQPATDPEAQNRSLNAAFNRLSDDAKLYVFYGVRADLNELRTWMTSYLDELDKTVAKAKDGEDIVTEAVVSSRDRLSDFLRVGYLVAERVSPWMVFPGFENVGNKQEQARQLDAWLRGDLDGIDCPDKKEAARRLTRIHNDILDGKLISRQFQVDSIQNTDGSYNGVSKFSYPEAPLPEQVLKHFIDNPEELARIINTTESLWLQRNENIELSVATAYKAGMLSAEGMALYRGLPKPKDIDENVDKVSANLPLYMPVDTYAELPEEDRAIVLDNAPYLADQLVAAIDYSRDILSDKGASFTVAIHDSDEPKVILDYFFSLSREDRHHVIDQTPGLSEDFQEAIKDVKPKFSDRGRILYTAMSSAPKRVVTREDFLRFSDSDRKAVMATSPAVDVAKVIMTTVEPRHRAPKDVCPAQGDYKSRLIANGALTLSDYQPVFETPFRRKLAEGWTMEQVIDATEQWLATEEYRDVEPVKRESFRRALVSGALIGQMLVCTEQMRPYADWLLKTINDPRPLAERFVVATLSDSENHKRIMKENDPARSLKNAPMDQYALANAWFATLNIQKMSTVLKDGRFDYKDGKQKAELDMLTAVLGRWTDRPETIRQAELSSFIDSHEEYKDLFADIKAAQRSSILSMLPVEDAAQLAGLRLSAEQTAAVLAFSQTLPKPWEKMSVTERIHILGNIVPDSMKNRTDLSVLAGVDLQIADSSMLTMTKDEETGKVDYALSPSEYADWLLGKKPDFMPDTLKAVHRSIIAGNIYPWDLAVGEQAWSPSSDVIGSHEAILRYYVEHPADIAAAVNENPALWTSYKKDAYTTILRAAQPSSGVLSNADKAAVAKVLNDPSVPGTAQTLFDALSDEGKKVLVKASPVVSERWIKNGPQARLAQPGEIYRALFQTLSPESAVRLKADFSEALKNDKLFRDAEQAGQVFRNTKKMSAAGIAKAVDELSSSMSTTRSVNTSYLGEKLLSVYLYDQLGPGPVFKNPMLSEDAILDFVRQSLGSSSDVFVSDGVAIVTDAEGNVNTFDKPEDLIKAALSGGYHPDRPSVQPAADAPDSNDDADDQATRLAEDRVEPQPESAQESIDQPEDAQDNAQDNGKTDYQKALADKGVNIDWSRLEEEKEAAKTKYEAERRSYNAALQKLGAEMIISHGPIAITNLRMSIQNWDGIWQEMPLEKKIATAEAFAEGGEEADAADIALIRDVLGSSAFRDAKTKEEKTEMLTAAFDTLSPDSKNFITEEKRNLDEYLTRFEALSSVQKLAVIELAKETLKKDDRAVIDKNLQKGWDDSLSRMQAESHLRQVFKSLSAVGMKKIIAHEAEVKNMGFTNIPYNVVTVASGLPAGSREPKSRSEFFASIPQALTGPDGKPAPTLIYDTRSTPASRKGNVPKEAVAEFCSKNGMTYYDASRELFEKGSDRYGKMVDNIREWAASGARVVLVTSQDNLLKDDISLTLCQDLYRQNVSVGHVTKDTSLNEVIEHGTLMSRFLRATDNSRLVDGSYADIDVTISYDEQHHRKVEFSLLNGATVLKNAGSPELRLFSSRQRNYATKDFTPEERLVDHGWVSQESLIMETAGSCDYGIFFVRKAEKSTVILSHDDTKLAESAVPSYIQIEFPDDKRELNSREAARKAVKKLFKKDAFVSKIVAMNPDSLLRLYVGGDNIAELTTGISYIGSERASSENLNNEQSRESFQTDSTSVIDTNEQVGIEDLNAYVRLFMEELTAGLREFQYRKETGFEEAGYANIPFTVVNVGESGVQQTANVHMQMMATRYRTQAYVPELHHTPRFTTTQPNPDFQKDHKVGKRYSDKALYLNVYNQGLKMKYTVNELNRETVTREMDKTSAIAVRGGDRDSVNRQVALDVLYKVGFSAGDAYRMSRELPDGLEEVAPADINALVRKANRSNRIVLPQNWSTEAIRNVTNNLGHTAARTPEITAAEALSSLERHNAPGGEALSEDYLRKIRLEIAAENYAQSVYVSYDREFGSRTDDVVDHIAPLLSEQGLTEEQINIFLGRGSDGLEMIRSTRDIAQEVGIINKAALAKAFAAIEGATGTVLSGQMAYTKEADAAFESLSVVSEKHATEKNAIGVERWRVKSCLARTDRALFALSEIYKGLDPKAMQKILEEFKQYISDGHVVDVAQDLHDFLYVVSKKNEIAFPDDLSQACIKESIQYVKEYHARHFNLPDGVTTPEVATLLCRWFGNTDAVRLISLVPEFYKQSGHDINSAETLMAFLGSDLVRARGLSLPDMGGGKAFTLENVRHELDNEAERIYGLLDTKVIGTVTFNDKDYPAELTDMSPYVIKTLDVATDADLAPKKMRRPRIVKTGASFTKVEMNEKDYKEHVKELQERFSLEHPIMVDLDTKEGRAALQQAPVGTPVLAWTANPDNPMLEKNGFKEKIEAGGGILVSREMFENDALDEESRARVSALSKAVAMTEKTAADKRQMEAEIESAGMAVESRKDEELRKRFVERTQDAPAALNYRGNIQLLNDPNSLGVISFLGETRISQNEGNNQMAVSAAGNIIGKLAATQERVTIAASLNCVSGRAVIEAALANDLPVIAVTADKLSGSANANLIDRVVEAGGVILSEADVIQPHDKDILYNKDILLARSSRLLSTIGTMTIVMECLHKNDVRLRANDRTYQDAREILSDKKEGVCVLTYGPTRTQDVIRGFLDVSDGEKVNYRNLYQALDVNGLVTTGTPRDPDNLASIDTKGMRDYMDEGVDSFKQYIRSVDSRMQREPNDFDAALSLVRKGNVLAISSSGEGVDQLLRTMREITPNLEYTQTRYNQERLDGPGMGTSVFEKPTMRIPVYRYEDIQVFVIGEEMTKARECIMRTYGDNVLFAETESAARSMLARAFSLPQSDRSADGIRVVDNIDASKTVLVYTTVADEAGQIFSMENCPKGLFGAESLGEDATASQNAQYLAKVDVTKKVMGILNDVAGYHGDKQLRVPGAIHAVYDSRKIEVYQGEQIVARVSLTNDGKEVLERIAPIILDEGEHGHLHPYFFTEAEVKNGISVQAFESRMTLFILSTEGISDKRLHMVNTDVTQSEAYLLETSRRAREEMEEAAANGEWMHQRGNVELYMDAVTEAIEKKEIVNEGVQSVPYDAVKSFASFSCEYERRMKEIGSIEKALSDARSEAAAVTAHIATFDEATDYSERTSSEIRLEREKEKIFDLSSKLATLRAEAAPYYAAMRAVATAKEILLLGTEEDTRQSAVNRQTLRSVKDRSEKRLCALIESLESSRKLIADTASGCHFVIDKDWAARIDKQIDERLDAAREALQLLRWDVKTVDTQKSNTKKNSKQPASKVVVSVMDASEWKKLDEVGRKSAFEATKQAIEKAKAVFSDSTTLCRDIESSLREVSHNPSVVFEKGKTRLMESGKALSSLIAEKASQLVECENTLSGLIEEEASKNTITDSLLPLQTEIEIALNKLEQTSLSSSFGASKEEMDKEREAVEGSLNKLSDLASRLFSTIDKQSNVAVKRLNACKKNSPELKAIILEAELLKEINGCGSVFRQISNELREVIQKRSGSVMRLHADASLHITAFAKDGKTLDNQLSILENGDTKVVPLDVIAINGVRTVVPGVKVTDDDIVKAMSDMEQMRKEISDRKAAMHANIWEIESARERSVGKAVEKDGYMILTNTLGNGNRDIYIAQHGRDESGQPRFTYWIGSPANGKPLTDKDYPSLKNFSLMGGRVVQLVDIKDDQGRTTSTVSRWNIVNRQGEEVLPYPVDEITNKREQTYCLAEGRPLTLVKLDGKYNLLDFKEKAFVLDEWTDTPCKAAYNREKKVIEVMDENGREVKSLDVRKAQAKTDQIAKSFTPRR